MKKTLLTFCLYLLPLSLTVAHAATALTGCAAKKQAIKTQLSYARQHNNTHQVAGLEKALREVDQHCSESSLSKERHEKVTEKKREVQELAKAKAEGRSASKIQKREDKLAEARQELNEAEQALSR